MSSASVRPPSQPRADKRGKSRGVTLLAQVLFGLALVAAVAVAFGTNVLAPGDDQTGPPPAGVEPGPPAKLASLGLRSLVEGDEAMSQVDRMHGLGIAMTGAYIAEYALGSEKAIVWVGTAESAAAATDLLDRMVAAIADGGPVFGDLQKQSFSGQEVFQVEGPGGHHYFYVSSLSSELVVWLTIDAADSAYIMERAIKLF